ncbi:MAG: hypothetical protein K2P48_10105 [Lachnospiraceae bacterium]|nr:hypothetical protein [Lachnospiraceae bacterium]
MAAQGGAGTERLQDERPDMDQNCNQRKIPGGSILALARQRNGGFNESYRA